MAKQPAKTVPKAAPAPVKVEPTPIPEVAPPTSVTNCVPGTRLHFGDGRSISFGETAEVGETLAAFLIGRGQAE